MRTPQCNELPGDPSVVTGHLEFARFVSTMPGRFERLGLYLSSVFHTWLTVALSRERRERAPDESLLRASRTARLECSGVERSERAQQVVRRSTAAAQCYTAR